MDDSVYIRDVEEAMAVIDWLVEEGCFVRERETRFDFLYQFDTMEDWLGYREEQQSESVLPPEVAERTRALLSEGSGELQIHEQGYAARLRRA